LKEGLWFRRGRLVMVSPVHGFMPQSGRKYTYPRCADSPSQLCNQGLASLLPWVWRDAKRAGLAA
jgi:hypothetical protein